jgi:hypothetical protein
MAARRGAATVNATSCRGLYPGPNHAGYCVPGAATVEHIAQPQDIADVVSYSPFDRSRDLCGATIEVNGGKAVA